MATTMDLQRAWSGPALFSYGFRPFFLSAAVLAALLVAAWVPWLFGFGVLPGALPPVAWHQHELLFGFVPAVVAGFLLTAVPNWTGRLPVVGRPLIVLYALWIAGRLVILGSAHLHPVAVAAISLAFPLALLATLAREILASGNRRNLKVLAGVGMLAAAQLVFHVEVGRQGHALLADRLAVGATVMLVMIVGGRIVPSFTVNWLKRENPGRLPVPFGRFDMAAMVGAGAALVLWILSAGLPALEPVAGAAMLLAGSAQAARLMRWAGDRTLAEPLVTVLHVGFVFVPAGFALLGAGLLIGDVPLRSAGMHAWTTGAIGLMTLAVMTRATRGHTGQELTAPPSTVVIYGLALAAAVLRIAASLAGPTSLPLMGLAGAAWVGAFSLFALAYGPLLVRRRE
jgi:uncharacterized protein involved in response to NO